MQRRFREQNDERERGSFRGEQLGPPRFCTRTNKVIHLLSRPLLTPLTPRSPLLRSGDPELRVAASLFDPSDSSSGAAAEGAGKQRNRRRVERTPEERERSRQARTLHWQVGIAIAIGIVLAVAITKHSSSAASSSDSPLAVIRRDHSIAFHRPLRHLSAPLRLRTAEAAEQQQH